MLALAMASIAPRSFAQNDQAPPALRCDGTEQAVTTSVAMGTDDPESKGRENAIKEVAREAIEACGGDIESRTQVEDAKVVSDSVLWASRGIVDIGKATGHIVPIQDKAGKWSYRYELTAFVTPTRMKGTPDRTFSVEVWTDKPKYSDGDAVRILGRTTQPAYIYIFNVGSDHSISLLFPTHLDPKGSNRVMPPEFVFPTDQLLSEGRKLRLAYDPSVETEHVTEYMEVLASKEALDLSSSGIAEAIGKPRNVGDTAVSTALAKVLGKMNADTVAFGVAQYELYRSISPQHQ